MKVNKLISRGLTLGFLLNYASVLSYANIEVPNRYQTLEGEYITIDDSVEGNLEEIEIFGNTVQDPDNLENIQSVGDLYVDEDGNSILDKQGREQYIINIKTVGENLFSGNLEKMSINGINGNIEPWELRLTNMFLIPCKKGDAISAKIFSNDFIFREFYYYSTTEINSSSYIGKVMKDSTVINYVKECVFTATEDGYFTFQIAKTDTTSAFTDEDVENAKKSIQISYSDKPLSKYNPYIETENTILLPTQLCKVGSISDRLYWDEGEKKYFIEKNIKEDILNGTEANWTKSYDWVNLDGQNTVSFQRPITGIIYNAQREIKILSNKFKSMEVSSSSTIINDEEWIRPYSSTSENVGIRILKSKLSGENVDDFKNWLKYNHLKIYYQLNSPEIIKTDINTKLTLPTYDGKTHIYIDSENALNSTLKVTIDRLPQIAKDTVTQANTDSNIYNISLARMYVNMLPESLYKDQLQEQLNNILNLNEMTLERKKVTANLDLYIKSENMLQMSLSTNSITFDDFSGVEDMTKENAVQISINSSLPYSLNTYLPTEIQSSNKFNIMDKSILNIKENTESVYQTFTNTTDKIVLKDNNPAGNNLSHGIDIKLKGIIAHQKDVYKTTIKFEAEQK